MEQSHRRRYAHSKVSRAPAQRSLLERYAQQEFGDEPLRRQSSISRRNHRTADWKGSRCASAAKGTRRGEEIARKDWRRKPKVDRKLRKSKENLRKLKAELNGGVSNTRRLRILRELSEAENDIAQGESDEAKLGRRVGVDLLEKLRQLDWKAGLRIALNVVGFAVTIVAVVFGGGVSRL